MRITSSDRALLDRVNRRACRRRSTSPFGTGGANIVRSIRAVGDWQGTPLRVSESFPDGQDAAVILQSPDGRIVGAAMLASG
jgi:hypothetical protein